MVEQSHNILAVPHALRRIRGLEDSNLIEKEKIKELKDFLSELDRRSIDSITERNQLSIEEWYSLVKKLENLNERLRRLNTLIIQEFKRLFALGFDRVNDTEDWVVDFDIELEVKFCIRKEDSAYDYNSENYVAIHRKSIRYTAGEFYIDYMESIDYSNQHNHDCTGHYRELPDILRRFTHTDMFRELYLMQNLSFVEIGRIKDIKFEFKTIYKSYKA
jgi:predicted transcriptional regulator